MAKCELTGKIPQSGNNVSHAKNRNKRKFKPNLQKVSFWSSKLNKKISITVATSAIRDIDKSKPIIPIYLTNYKKSKKN